MAFLVVKGLYQVQVDNWMGISLWVRDFTMRSQTNSMWSH